MDHEILEFIKERGLLLEKPIYDLIENINDATLAKNFLSQFEELSGEKIITINVLSKNVQCAKGIVENFSGDTKKRVEKLFVNLGITFEIQKETTENVVNEIEEIEKPKEYEIIAPDTENTKKVDLKDFVGHFRTRYQKLQRLLMQRPGLENLTSINKLSGNRQSITIIGMVTEKRITNNNNLIIKFEDMTGEVNALAKEGTESFDKAKELQLDDVVAIKASGNNELIFIFDVTFPDSIILEKVHFEKDDHIAFVSDVHVGSKKHLGKEFQTFLDWLNSGDEMAEKIKYIFFVGDNVDGVGVFPGQESLLNLTSLKQQYEQLAVYLKQIPSRITMFMCPGQHDSVRVAEPQPVIDDHYGEALYDIPNLILVPNPTTIKLKEKEKEFKVLMYHGASIHTFINEIEELRVGKAHKTPAKAVKHMLKRRHLAPMHGVSHSIVYVPNPEGDPMVISETPDVLCTGEVHRVDVDNYNGTLILTGSCWQAQTDFEEKIGNIPDPCKVPILNLQTRALKILDFEEKDETE